MPTAGSFDSSLASALTSPGALSVLSAGFASFGASALSALSVLTSASGFLVEI